MRARALLLAVMLTSTACATHQPGQSSSTATAQNTIETIGTPFYAIFKGVACAATAIVAVPAASAAQIIGRPSDLEFSRQVYQGVGRTCGGSYRLGS